MLNKRYLKKKKELLFGLICQVSLLAFYKTLSLAVTGSCSRATAAVWLSVHFMASHLVQERPSFPGDPPAWVSAPAPTASQDQRRPPEVQPRTSGHIYGAASPVLLTVLATRLTATSEHIRLSQLLRIRPQPWRFPAFLFRSRTTPSCLTASSPPTNPASLSPSIRLWTRATSALAAACPPLPPWTPSASRPPPSAPPEGDTSLWMISSS